MLRRSLNEHGSELNVIMKLLKQFLFPALVCACPLHAASPATTAPAKPNVIFILSDDIGRGDISALGGKQGETPNLDRLASEGTVFQRFYVASPICSASRTAFVTGMFPARWKINSFLHERSGNAKCEQANWLDPKAPIMARAFKEAGYATAHFGKWHLGGGRDVQDAPLPSAYGFDESHVNCEGMGPRFEDFGTGGKPALNSEDGKQYFRHDMTRYWVDRSLEFIKRQAGKPFYLELWPQDVHSPHNPSPEALARTATPGLPNQQHSFRGVLNEYDRQIGRFMDALRQLGLEKNTIVVFTGDNGPEPSFEHARTLGQRGMKWSLYEGGLHEPFFVRWPGHVPAGKTNEVTLVSSVDCFPTLCALAGVNPPANAPFDGVDQSAAWLGATPQRKTPLFWEYGRKPKGYRYPRPAEDKSPNLCVREGDWKLLVNADGTKAELYNAATDPKETTNAAAEHPEIASRLTKLALEWRKSLP